ncbi:hypothetical protein V6X69_07865 [Spiribacter sp. 370]|uniref:Uncharacterized protein n=1 Tax=Spiribacter pallidus TaxID=1987936 RepID=A0ABV3TE62_9GAMM
MAAAANDMPKRMKARYNAEYRTEALALKASVLEPQAESSACTQMGSTPPLRTISLSVVSDPLVVQPADAFSGCAITQYNQRHHFAPRPALDSAGDEPDQA